LSKIAEFGDKKYKEFKGLMDLSKKLWIEAIHIAMHIFNRTINT
jgi:hypothetical protein